ncbi:MAG TPA: hypothetical protein VIJ94_07585, partial [Caulobacteraceae bacterium]
MVLVLAAPAPAPSFLYRALRLAQGSSEESSLYNLREAQDQILAGADMGLFDSNIAEIVGQQADAVLGPAIQRLCDEAAGEPILIEDPRTVRLLPVWDAILASRQIEARFVVSLRVPAVASAGIAEMLQLPRIRAEAIWSSFMIRIGRFLAKRDSLLLHEEQLYADWRNRLSPLARELRISWPPSPDLAVSIQQLADADVRVAESGGKVAG